MRFLVLTARTISQTVRAMGTPRITTTMGIQSIGFTFQPAVQPDAAQCADQQRVRGKWQGCGENPITQIHFMERR